MAEQYWRDLWEEIDPMKRRLLDWKSPWINTQFANGTEMQDGNPIFSAVSQTKMRGIRIIQLAPESQSVALEFWLATFGGDIADLGSILTDRKFDFTVWGAGVPGAGGLTRRSIEPGFSGNYMCDSDSNS